MILHQIGWRTVRGERLGGPRRAGEPDIGARLRRETTLTIKAIARRIHLGTSKSANIRLHTAMRHIVPVQTAQAKPIPSAAH